MDEKLFRKDVNHKTPGWYLKSRDIELFLTEDGGQHSPVTFRKNTEKPVQTYFISPWQDQRPDLSAIPLLKNLTHLPVVVDPSHATGQARLVKPMSLAATAAGADGIMIEVHNDPPHALCDGAQSLTPEQFADVAARVRKIREVIA